MSVRPTHLGIAVAIVTAALDQATKLWMVYGFELGERSSIPIVPFLDLVLAYNRGISYSLFPADSLIGRLVLIAIAIIALVVIAIWLRQTRSALAGAALGLVAGGALGNVIDRIRTGAVIDFLHFHTPISLGPLSNYVFNLADAAIFVGVIGLLYESFTSGRPAASREFES